MMMLLNGKFQGYLFIGLFMLIVLAYGALNIFAKDKVIAVHNFAYAKLNLLGQSNVIKGQDDWFYFHHTKDGTKITADYQGLVFLSNVEVKRRATRIKDWQTYVTGQGAYFLMVMAPEKQSIYPEYLPARIQKVSNTSRKQQILQYFDAHNIEINTLDLEPALKNHKDQTPDKLLYHKFDSHWNSYGAFIAYQNIMQRLKGDKYSDLKVLSLKDLQMREIDNTYKDLLRMMQISNQFTETELRYSPLQNSPLTKGAFGSGRDTVEQFEGAGLNDLHLMVFYDSFSKELRPYLNQSFSKVTYVRHDGNPDFSQIEIYKPDVVLYQVVERQLDKL